MPRYAVALALAIAYADLTPDRAHAFAAAVGSNNEQAQAAVLATLSPQEQLRVHAAIIDGDADTFRDALDSAVAS